MIYQGFWDIALKKMEARLSGLRPLPIPSDLKQQEIVMEGKGKRPDTKTMFTTHAYALPGKIRQARAALLYTENTPPKVSISHKATTAPVCLLSLTLVYT